ncbi:AP-2 complex subunit alpha-2, partial [Trifolium medium]|nr:AP-2 complex subunit alpha-2 [Trifolium medium]
VGYICNIIWWFCSSYVMHLDAEKEMMSQLGKFIAFRQSNIRYLGLYLEARSSFALWHMCDVTNAKDIKSSRFCVA